jgi:perosamine synthetase
MKIPLCVPDLGEEELALVKEVLDSGWLAHGPYNKLFEAEFAKYIGVKHAVTLNSCTAALQLALQTQKITGEVIVPSFTFVASANAIITAGAKPVFVDIDYDTCNIDPSKIEAKITSRTQAIMPVHYAGQACRMDEIMDIAERRGLRVIEDSAETIGGTYKGKKTGNFGIGCFSFYPTKNMTTGEGGVLTTDDDKIAELARTYRGHGISSSTFEREKKEQPWLRSASLPGYNFRLCDILAAIGVAQLRKLDDMNERRRQHAAYLNSKLQIEGIELPVELLECKHVYQMYTIKLADGIDRTAFLKFLRDKEIGASVHFDPPVHLQHYYRAGSFDTRELKVTEMVAKRIVTLPMYPTMTREQLDFMVGNIYEAIKFARR